MQVRFCMSTFCSFCSGQMIVSNLNPRHNWRVLAQNVSVICSPHTHVQFLFHVLCTNFELSTTHLLCSLSFQEVGDCASDGAKGPEPFVPKSG